MNSMFFQLISLTLLDLSNFDTSQVVTMNNMLDFYSSVKKLDLSNFNSSNVIDMS